MELEATIVFRGRRNELFACSYSGFVEIVEQTILYAYVPVFCKLPLAEEDCAQAVIIARAETASMPQIGFVNVAGTGIIVGEKDCCQCG